MNLRLELPKETLLVGREDLRAVLLEVLAEVHVQNEKGEIMTIQETAEFLKVSIPTVRAMIARKDIPFFQRGQVIRLNRWDIQEWMRKNAD